MNFRPIRNLRELTRTLDELRCAHEAAEESARFELAQSATRFSQRSKEVVDSTMSLSAVLMRAGEVDHANRLLQEAHLEVANEEAVLLETVEEVKAEGALRKERMTRLRLAKMLASALLGASLMVTSAFGVVLASWFSEGSEAANVDGRQLAEKESDTVRRSAGRGVRALKIAGVRLELTPSELEKYRRLTNGSVDDAELESFLLAVLPKDLARKVHAALVSVASTDVSGIVPDAEEIAGHVLTAKKAEQGEEAAEAEAEEASDAPAEAKEDPDKKPAADDDGKNDDGDGGGDDGANNNHQLPQGIPLVGGEEDEGT